MPTCTVTNLTLYPIKSCQGVDVRSIEVRKEGIVGDRQLMLVHDGEGLGQKDAPELARVAVTPLAGGRLRLQAPGQSELVHEVRAKGDALPAKLIFNDITTRDQGDEAAAWFSQLLGRPVRLVDLPEAWDRWMPLPEFALIDGKPQGRFFDAAQVLLVGQASLDDLNERLAAPVPMERFRANVVVEGLPAFGEDALASVSSQDVTLDYATVCERCIVITTDQKTGERAKEPLNTLSQYRKREGGYAGGIVFGAYMAVGREGTLRVGDVLKVHGPPQR